ncbi:MAG: hypothetical protein EAZ78_08990 [Oscillatoriales cyanobacterium]|uniref:Transposase n=1 Tax=Microcoleus anatoxicus PTRS2 TaxID=2705321 RepID=A0ABU8YVT4_9CYAN|nr:MAG: hypothetical protein EA000_02035 [Oscillatoriales cyanobacterium]TAD95749.1 MAG: hypothetical protein EAZ98_14660 [Oscillatoriales cyanobacterium]TAF04498.1 MAG: hypothetical protein EAZ78_08990 [Oscillatoriales cyanobacterium]TAF64055.1 MAG: hypothetical protein EAZ59_19435 [Oscillatoriales cyanobacterium]
MPSGRQLRFAPAELPLATPYHWLSLKNLNISLQKVVRELGAIEKLWARVVLELWCIALVNQKLK